MSRILTEQQIQEAKALRLSGYTKRRLAEKFGVGQTTIWDNVFYYKGKKIRHIKQRQKEVPKISRYKIIVFVIKLKKQEGHTSGEIAQELDLPLADVNHVYSMYYKDTVV